LTLETRVSDLKSV